MKKYKFIFIIIFFIILPTISFADENYEETISYLDFDFTYQVSTNTSITPIVNARNAIILDRSSKTVLYEKNGFDMCKMASTTKIMTAIIVLENCKDLNELVTVSKKSARNWRI